MKIAAAAAFALAGTTGAVRDALDKPNIVMLFVDDLGYGDTNFNGHPTTYTPNIDKLAWGGKILTSWYSGCPVCSGSRGGLMTGRQYNRIGLPGVFGPTVATGLPLNETTVADQLKKVGYSTAAMGKWHLGQRSMHLPANRGFDYYLGIPYSDDMGAGRVTPCKNATATEVSSDGTLTDQEAERVLVRKAEADWSTYIDSGYVHEGDDGGVGAAGVAGGDPAGNFLPLVYQEHTSDGKINTTVLEQPLDFSTLAPKYKDYVVNFIAEKKDEPFFLYMPFSHVHTTRNTAEKQYADCSNANTTRRGMFGDALAEVDWIVGEVTAKLEAEGIDKNTLIMFTGDNGPWMIQGKSGGSEGLFTGRYSGYWNTGKGATWEGGIHEAGFAYWPGQIDPFTRTSEVVSSMDLLPTASALAGVPLPSDRVYDGKDASDVLLDKNGGKSHHTCLFFYGGAAGTKTPSAASCVVGNKRYKAHWATGPGLGGCANCSKKSYPDVPLVFDIDVDPSEAYPIVNDNKMPGNKSDLFGVVNAILAAYKHEVATFYTNKLVQEPDGPNEGPDMYGVCCDRVAKGKAATCDCNGPVAWVV